jgi:ABC-2 type transport system permease protein
MPIYDQGYQRWKGELQRYPVRWWPILRHGVLEVIKQRKYLLLIILGWLGPFTRGVQLFLNSRTSSLRESIDIPALRGLFADGMDFYWSTLQQQSFIVLLFMAFVGSDLIARDRRHNALQIYFSKPLTVNDYILGKLGILAAFALFVTWVPILLLWLFALTLQLRADYLRDVWSLPLVATAYCALMILVMGGLMLALSSVGRRAIIIVVSFIVVYGYGPLQGVTEILKGLSSNEYWGLLRIAGNLDQVGAWWFGARRPEDFHPSLSLLALAALIAGCYWLLRRRIRPVEVVL